MDYEIRYLGPTDTDGSRFRVSWMTDISKVRAEVSFDYAARDPFTAALSEVTGIPENLFERLDPQAREADQRWYWVRGTD